MKFVLLFAALAVSAGWSATPHKPEDIVGRIYSLLVREGFPQPPVAMTAEARQSVMERLPKDGPVDLDSKERAKLETVDEIFTAHGRHGIISVKVVRLPYACVALHARSVLIIAERTLRALTAEQLQAAVAHELGHEYVWAEYYRAKEKGDLDGLRSAELLADAIAVRTLIRLGKNPGSLIAAIARMNSYNAYLGLEPLNSSSYPSIGDRRRFHELVADLISKR